MRKTALLFVFHLLLVCGQSPNGFNILKFGDEFTNKLFTAGCGRPTPNLQVCTESAANSAGATFWNAPVLTRGFTTTFQLRFGPKVEGGAEGVAFIVSGQAPEELALAAKDYSLGYGGKDLQDSRGMTNTFAVEFDLIHNPETDGNILGPHYSVHSSSSFNSANENDAITHQPLTNEMSGRTHNISITYEPQNFEDGGAPERVSASIEGAPLLATQPLNPDQRNPLLGVGSNGQGYVGFTAYNSKSGQSQEIISWSFKFLGRLSPQLSKTTLDNKSVVSGDTITVTVIDVDQYKNDMIDGSTTWTLSLSGETTETVQFTPVSVDKNDGKSVFTFAPKKAAKNVHVVATTQGKSTNAEFSDAFEVRPGSPAPAQSVVTKAPLEQVIAGVLQQIEIMLVDDNGNNNAPGDKDKANIKFNTFPADDPNVEDDPEKTVLDGVVTISWNRKAAGSYAMDILYDNTVVFQGSNKQFTVIPAAADSSKSIIDPAVPQDVNIMAGVPYAITLQLYDTYNNKITNPSDGDKSQQPTLSVTSTSGDSESINAAVSNINNGQYTLTLQLNTVGSYSGELKLVSMNGGEDKTVPVSINVQAGNIPSAPNSQLLPISAPWNFTAGVKMTFQVQLKDQYGNYIHNQPDYLSWRLDITSNKKQLPAQSVHWTQKSVTDDGLAEIEFSVDTTGENLEMLVFVNNTQVGGDPLSFSVLPGLAAGGHSTVSTDIQLNTRIDDTEKFVIYTKDQFGNSRKKGGDDVKVLFTPAEPVTVKVNDTGNSQYDVTYKISTSGAYKMRVTINGQEVEGSPFTVNCKWVMSTGAIAGISIGLICLVIIIAAGLYIWKKKLFHGKRLYQRLNTEEPT